MRRLPVYFLIDISESMVGEPAAEVEKGIHFITRELRQDPYALETVWLSVLAFAGNAVRLSPLTELIDFQPPSFPIGSGTSLGKGLELLMRSMDEETRKTTRESKGDWKPIVFLFTDGAATDNPQAAIKEWQRKYASACNLAVITFGNTADVNTLRELGGEVFTLSELSGPAFREFFKWVSASIQVSSLAVSENGQAGKRLETRGCINLEKAAPCSGIDDNCVILPAKCSSKKDTYLIKYVANPESPGTFNLDGAHIVDGEAYARLGGTGEEAALVDSRILNGAPPCPVCGNQLSIIQCGNCNKITCGSPDSEMICPWCGNSGIITSVEKLDLERGRG